MQICSQQKFVKCVWVMVLFSGAVPFRLVAQASEPPAVHSAGTVEDWTSLSLKGSELKPEAPIVGEKAELPEFTRELIQVKWRMGDAIDLYIIRPKNVPKPPVILYLYSYPSETNRFRSHDYCARITQNGFAAVGFVSALTGQRFTMRPMKEWFVSELQESLASSVHDVQLILNYLSERNDLDMSRVGMFGTGSGATIAILSAAIDPRIQTIDLLEPWGDWPDWLAKSSIIPENERTNYLKPEFLKRVAPLDPVQWLPQLKTEHIRMQYISDDTVTSKVAQDRMEAAAPPQAKVQHFETGQRFYSTSAGGRIFEWIKPQMQAASPTQPRTEDTRAAPAAARDSGATSQ
jgi:acetyl esterase/lipase